MTIQYPAYDITEWAPHSGACDYCEEGADYGVHRHAFYVSREGASHRTADELIAVFAMDVADLLALPEPWGNDGYYAEEVVTLPNGETVTNPAIPYPDGWLDDPDLSQALYDSMSHWESLLSDAGLYVSWNDGYVIERVEEAP